MTVWNQLELGQSLLKPMIRSMDMIAIIPCYGNVRTFPFISYNSIVVICHVNVMNELVISSYVILLFY